MKAKSNEPIVYVNNLFLRWRNTYEERRKEGRRKRYRSLYKRG